MVRKKISVKKLKDNAMLPSQKTEGAAGFDLYTVEDVWIEPFNVVGSVSISTGIALEIPKGYHGKLILRSSTGKNTRLRLSNQVGIIDSDYRGEIKILMDNMDRQSLHIMKGTRLCQILIEANTPVEFVWSDSISKTKRASGGFGSTGA